jgi:hypothetical protein
LPRILLVKVLENPNEYYGQPSVGPRFLDGSMSPLQKLSCRLSSADVALDSEAVLHPCFVGQQEGAGQTRLTTLKEDSASSRVAATDAAPLRKAGAIGRSAQYIC